MPEQRGLADSSSSARTKITLKDWSVGAEIGKGSYARVYLGRNKPSGLTVAIKDVDTTRLNAKLKRHLRDEINILKSLQHPHIVALVDFHESSNHIYFMMEYCELGDMALFIRKRDKLVTHPATHEMARKYPNPPNAGLNEVIVRHFLKQLASSMEYLRQFQLVHRDIKPQNLLLVPPSQYREGNKSSPAIMQASKDSFVPTAGLASFPMLKLADFGFARSLPSTALAETLCGSPLYMAPEILAYEKYDSKADLWSIGTVLYEMITGRPHFRAQNHVELLKKIKDAKDVIKFPEKTVVSSELKACIRSLLKVSSVERISWENFFTHPIVQGTIPGLVEDDLPKKETPAPTRLSERRSLREMRADSKSEEQQSLQRRASGRRYATDTDQIRDATPPSPRDRSIKSAFPTDIAKQPPNPPGEVVHRGSYSPRFSSGEGLGIRRPQPIPSTSAPNRPALYEDRRRQSTPTGGPVSRNTPSPTSSLAEAASRRRSNTATSRRTIDEQEKAAQEVAFERDYVVVVKEHVEVNAFADEMAANPRLGGQAAPLSPKSGQMVRRATQQGNPTSATGAIPTPPSRTMQGARGYHDRRQSLSGSPGAAASFITKAIHDAGVRLLGPKYPLSLIGGKGSSPPQAFPAFPPYTSSTPVGLIGDGKQVVPSLPLDEDARVTQLIEDYATRSDVVYGFAEVKYKQLIPLAPSIEHGLGGVSTESDEDDVLTAEAVVVLSEEALVLYVKALSLLAKSMNIANMWWTRKRRSESGVISSSPVREASGSHNYTQRINSAVQWVRSRFNEVLEKAEIVRLKLIEGQKQLPEEHPSNPCNREAGPNSDEVYLTEGISAEKLIYDRAVEMSRTAAINELTSEDLHGCEISYATSIKMFEAVLDCDDNDVPGRRVTTSGDESSVSKTGGAPAPLSPDDQRAVQSMITGIEKRLAVIRKKIQDLNKVQQQHQQLTLGRRRSGDITPRSVPAHGS